MAMDTIFIFMMMMIQLNNFYHQATKFLHENGKYNGVVTASNHISEFINRDGLNFHQSKRYNPNIKQIYLHELLEENIFAPIAFLFKREAFNEVGHFNEDLEVLGDWDFNIRFLEKFNIGFIEQPLANYHHRDVRPDPVFGNSVTAGVDKHIKYQPIVK